MAVCLKPFDFSRDNVLGYRIKYTHSEIEGRRGVQTPYNAEFVTQLKNIIPSATYDKIQGKPTWFYDEEDQAIVTDLVSHFFINVQWLRLGFNFSGDYEVSVDGVHLIRLNRDDYTWRGDFRIKVIEDEIRTGGSRRNPKLSGTAVIDVLCRPDAEIYPEPVFVKESSVENHIPNPLDGVPAKDMLDNLSRRMGELVETMGERGHTIILADDNVRQRCAKVEKVMKEVMRSGQRDLSHAYLSVQNMLFYIEDREALECILAFVGSKEGK